MIDPAKTARLRKLIQNLEASPAEFEELSALVEEQLRSSQVSLDATPVFLSQSQSNRDEQLTLTLTRFTGGTPNRVIPDRPLEQDLPDRYHAVRRLGVGGVGEVWLVRDHVLNRAVALKALHPRHSGHTNAVVRFLEEAQTVARLQHPGLLPIYDAGALPSGRLYFTMREVNGRTLADVSREVHHASTHGQWNRGPSGWTFHRLMQAFRVVCETVAYAHNHGVLHRDLKPTNVMTGQFGEVLVLDWGLAKSLGAKRSPSEPALKEDPQPDTQQQTSSSDAHGSAVKKGETQMGDVVGTPAYMSPEQAAGQQHRIGPPTDIYALGCILYHLLSGRAPFEGNSVDQILEKVLEGNPTLPSRGQPAKEPKSEDDGDQGWDDWSWNHNQAEDQDGAPQDGDHPDRDHPDRNHQDRDRQDRDRQDRDHQDGDHQDGDHQDGVHQKEVDPSSHRNQATTASGPGPVPAALERLCMRAMAKFPEDRPTSAQVLADAVADWLEQARRHEEADTMLEEALRLHDEASALRLEVARHQRDAKAFLAKVPAAAPIEEKRPGWHLQDEGERMLMTVMLKELEHVQWLRGALTHAPDHPGITQALVNYYHRCHANAEQDRQDAVAAQWALLLKQADRRFVYASYLKGDGALTLITDPPGAEVELFRHELVDRRLEPTFVANLGPTPIREASLPMGSYLLVITAKGRRPVRYPVRIRRQTHWHGRPPGASAPRAIYLPPDDALGPDDVYVPAGWTWCGGDPDAGNSLPLKRLWLEGFTIRRYPVTNEAYLRFLNSLAARGQLEDALIHRPQVQTHRRSADQQEAFILQPQRRFILDPSIDGLLPQWPVVLVDWISAVAYARWLAEEEGRPWRLPYELEWEKAARGVDERVFPWGNHFDPTWACVGTSHTGTPHPAQVTDFPEDCSPYGVQGLSGNARDMCADEYRTEGCEIIDACPVMDPATDHTSIVQVARGGDWFGTEKSARSCTRFRIGLRARLSFSSFRLATSYPEHR